MDSRYYTYRSFLSDRFLDHINYKSTFPSVHEVHNTFHFLLPMPFDQDHIRIIQFGQLHLYGPIYKNYLVRLLALVLQTFTF
eukprot:UN01838